jgi:hypothetical protein
MTEPEPTTAAEWISRRRTADINAIRLRTRRGYGRSAMLADIGDRDAEGTARTMLREAASAFWNAEDTELESVTHEEMDTYGRWARPTFGCYLAFESGAYYQRCPIAIAHKRVGMSIGFDAKRRICTLCGEDFAECPHLIGRLYEVPGGVGPDRLAAAAFVSPLTAMSTAPSRLILLPERNRY